MNAVKKSMFDYGGSIHVHSRYSFDGTTGIEEIIAAARRRALDFIVVTDHACLGAKDDGWEGWHDGLLVLVGEEISPRFNHLLALGINTPVAVPETAAEPQRYIDAVNAQGGIGLIAHPDHTGAPKFGVKEYPWTDWDSAGYAGISVWDLMTDWQEKLSSPLAALKAYVSPAWSLGGPKKETLRRWDALNGARRVTGFGEVDNHNAAKKYLGFEFRILPFDYAFSTVRTRLFLTERLSADAEEAKAQVYAALKSGRAYVAQERWKRAKGFTFRVHGESGEAYPGDEFVLPRGGAVAEADVPHPGRLALVHNGSVIAQTTGRRLEARIQTSGVYRIEAEQKIFGAWKPWIYSNPVRVKTSGKW